VGHVSRLPIYGIAQMSKCHTTDYGENSGIFRDVTAIFVTYYS
jgi:hypothetical protein